MNFEWHEKLLIWNILPYTFQLLLILRKDLIPHQSVTVLLFSVTSTRVLSLCIWRLSMICWMCLYTWFMACRMGRVLPSTSFGLLCAGKNSLYSRRQRHSVMRFAFGCSADTPPDKYSLRKEKRKQIKNEYCHYHSNMTCICSIAVQSKRQ